MCDQCDHPLTLEEKTICESEGGGEGDWSLAGPVMAPRGNINTCVSGVMDVKA